MFDLEEFYCTYQVSKIQSYNFEFLKLDILKKIKYSYRFIKESSIFVYF